MCRPWGRIASEYGFHIVIFTKLKIFVHPQLTKPVLNDNLPYLHSALYILLEP